MPKVRLYHAKTCIAKKTQGDTKVDVLLLHVGVQRVGTVTMLGETFDGVDIGKGRWAFLPTTEKAAKVLIDKTNTIIDLSAKEWDDSFRESEVEAKSVALTTTV